METTETKQKIETHLNQQIKDFSKKKTNDMVNEVKYELGMEERPLTFWEEQKHFIKTNFFYDLDKKTVKDYQVVLSNWHTGWRNELKKQVKTKVSKKG